MRLAIVSAVVVAGLAAPALACPPREACLVSLRSTVGEPTVRDSAKPTATETVARALQVPVATKPKLVPGEVEMPWIWRVLREQVYSRMPTYEKKRDDLKIVLAPVVVTSLTDTVPGVGLSGDF